MNAALAMMPEEEQVKYSAMTGQSLFYMSETNLRHKILAIVEEGGAERASYALKLLQSEGELTIASTGKDPTNGRLVTHEYRGRSGDDPLDDDGPLKLTKNRGVRPLRCFATIRIGNLIEFPTNCGKIVATA